MAATDQNYRNQYILDIVFAVSSILMLASIVWMLWDDYMREYKTEQRQFRDVEAAMAQREALKKMAGTRDESDKFADEIKKIQRSRDELEQPLTKSIGELKKLLDDFDRQVNLAIKKQWGVGDYFRSMWFVEAYAAPTKIEQVTLNDLTIDYNFKGVTRFDRCMTCHKGIARPSYTKENLADLIYVADSQTEKQLQEAHENLALRKQLLPALDEGRN